MAILDSWKDGSLIVSICTPYRHIENLRGALFRALLDIFSPFFQNFVFKTLTLTSYEDQQTSLNAYREDLYTYLVDLYGIVSHKVLAHTVAHT